MTDWCETDMKVYGKRKDLDKFKTEVDSRDKLEVISFEKIIPIPENSSDWDRNIDNSGLYNWRRENWGTISDASYSKLTDNEDHLYYYFCTAWRPPLQVYETLISNYQTLDFDIIAIEDYLYQCVDIASNNGRFTNYITWWDKSVQWKYNKNKTFWLKADLVKDSLEVVEGQPQLYD